MKKNLLLLSLVFLLLPIIGHAATMTGGNYTLHGGATAISGAQSSGGTYSEGATSDSASGKSSGGTYSITPVPGASGTPATPAPSNSPQNTTDQNSGGVSGQSAPSPSATISISEVRVVRVSPTSVAISFSTSIDSVGRITYLTPDGARVTLTDSAAREQHSFTVTDLTPSFAYTFILSANQNAEYSNGYQTSLSPESIGSPGQSVSPRPITEVGNPWIGTNTSPEVEGGSVTAPGTASSTRNIVKLLSPGFLIIVSLLALITGILIVWGFIRRRN